MGHHRKKQLEADGWNFMKRKKPVRFKKPALSIGEWFLLRGQEFIAYIKWWVALLSRQAELFLPSRLIDSGGDGDDVEDKIKQYQTKQKLNKTFGALQVAFVLFVCFGVALMQRPKYIQYPDTLKEVRVKLIDGRITAQEQYQAALDGNKVAMYAVAARLVEPSPDFELGSVQIKEKTGFEKDKEKEQEGFEWYNRSASLGFAPAQYVLGQMYEAGLGPKGTGRREAEALFRRAAENAEFEAIVWNNRAYAMTALGNIYWDGKAPFKKNRTEALMWFEKARVLKYEHLGNNDFGFLEASYGLCNIYFHEEDYVAAFAHCIRAGARKPNAHRAAQRKGMLIYAKSVGAGLMTQDELMAETDMENMWVGTGLYTLANRIYGNELTIQPPTNEGKESDGCVDENESCNGWASDGECFKNKEYMHLSCKFSCGICPGQLKARKRRKKRMKRAEKKRARREAKRRKAEAEAGTGADEDDDGEEEVEGDEDEGGGGVGD